MKIEISRLINDKDYCRKVFNFFINKEIIKRVNPALFEKHLNKSLDNLEFGNFIISNLNIQGEEIKFIVDSKDIREKASYGVDEEFDFRIARELQKKTADFVNKVKEILNE